MSRRSLVLIHVSFGEICLMITLKLPLSKARNLQMLQRSFSVISSVRLQLYWAAPMCDCALNLRFAATGGERAASERCLNKF